MSSFTLEYNVMDVVFELNYSGNLYAIKSTIITNAQGGNLPSGGLKRQVLQKNSNASNDYSWNYSYYDFLINCEYNGNEVVITNGDVLEAEIDGILIYRFISNSTNSNGYPFEDSFYSTFDNGVLSNLMTTRG